MTDNTKREPHKHAATIKAWADGAKIEYQRSDGTWGEPIGSPSWSEATAYRVKPEPHKWQKEIDAYHAGKDVQFKLLCWPEGRWQTLPQPPRADKPREFEFTSDTSTYRIKPKRVAFILLAERGPAFVRGIQVQSTAHPEGNLELIFEDGKLVEARVL